MEFSEKLNALLSLTASKGSEMATAINVDAAQISRLKTGARKMPRDPNFLRDMSGFLATRTDSDYKLTALLNLTGDVRLHNAVDVTVLTDIIYDWITLPDDAVKNPTRTFLDRFNNFSEHGGSTFEYRFG